MALVKYLQYKGENLPYRIGYYAIKKTQSETNAEIMSEKGPNDMEKMDPEVYEVLLYYALEQGHRIEEKDFDMNKDEMQFVLDENFAEFFGGMPDFFQGLEEAKQKAQTTKQKQNKK